MDTLLYIEEYFAGEPSEDLKKEFEKRIREDAGFAEDVVFYLSAKEMMVKEVQTEKKERFRELYGEYKKTNTTAALPSKSFVRKLWPYISVAAILISVIIGWVVFSDSASPEQLADKYIKENFLTLGVTMGSKEDSLQTGNRLYNEGKLNDALGQFEGIIKSDTSAIEAKKNAGIVCLRMQQYDKAIRYFSQLGSYTHLYANPGKLYQAITLIKRNLPGDKQEAKGLLEEIVRNNLDEKETAEKMLSNW